VNHHERVVAFLSEVNPAVAAAVRAAGCSGAGYALPGLLTWMPPADLVDLARACHLAFGNEAEEMYGCTVEEMADQLSRCDVESERRYPHQRDRIDAACHAHLEVRLGELRR